MCHIITPFALWDMHARVMKNVSLQRYGKIEYVKPKKPKTQKPKLWG